MGRYDGIMILSDLDGTLLGKGGRIVPRNIEAIRAFCREGGRFTIATGRHAAHLRQALPEVVSLVNMEVVTANGACLYDFAQERATQETFMETGLTRDILLYAREHYPDLGFRITTPLGFLTDGRGEIIERFIRDAAGQRYTVEVAPIEQWDACERRWYKVVFRGDGRRLDALEADVRRLFGDVLCYSKSSDTFFELQHASCSKGIMLRQLKKKTEAALGRAVKTCAVGDYGNDISMLRAADVAVCPANAHPDVKAICDLCLCDHDEGVLADLIGRL